MNAPLAYHITFGTYGTRLHGDDRGTIDRSMNRFGEPIIGACADWERMERHLLNFPPRIFTLDQMTLIESLIPAVCTRGNWRLHTCAAAPDHVHVLLTGPADGDSIRKWLKRWLTQCLIPHLPLEEHHTFWAECGSVKWVWTAAYFSRVQHYVQAQRATP